MQQARKGVATNTCCIQPGIPYLHRYDLDEYVISITSIRMTSSQLLISMCLDSIDSVGVTQGHHFDRNDGLSSLGVRK